MPYVTKNDDISALPLSVRSQNCLRRVDIHTIGAMMDYPIDELINIRNMGKKSIEEIQSLIQALNEGTCEFVLVEAGCDSAINSSVFQKDQDSTITVFIDETGLLVQDFPTKNLPLSVRARNSLTRNGYEFASQLVGITYDELMKLKNMGKKTAEEVLGYITKISVRHGTGAIAIESIDSSNTLPPEMCAVYGEEESVWLREILTIKAQFPEAMGETLIYRLYNSDFVRGTLKAKI